jgi:NAD(P)-dependent dehydrogenase (short-subunit alcohol dehydrogenase family)
MTSSARLKGRVAIVTGASRGIGKAVAERLVAEGAQVCLTARDAEKLAAAAAGIGDDSVVMTVAGKSHDPEHQAEVVGAVLDRFGRIDVMVNNAATNPVFGGLMEIQPAAAAKIFEVNVLAPLRWAQQVYRAAFAEHGGVIVNMASVAGIGVSPGIATYGASKAALINLTKQLAVELGPSVRVNAVAPAVVKTQFAAALYEGNESEVASRYPLRRLGVPDDVGAAVAYLASDDASWVTGQVLTLDGGVTLTSL